MPKSSYALTSGDKAILYLSSEHEKIQFTSLSNSIIPDCCLIHLDVTGAGTHRLMQ